MFRTKDIHVAMKKDNPISELMNDFGFATQEELFEAIRKISPQASKEFIRKLLKKSKRSQQHAEEAGTVNAEVEEVAETNSIEEVEEAEIYEAEEAEIEEPHATKLEQLLKDEKELSDWLYALEVEHKNFVSRRGEIAEELVKSKSTLQKLRAELSKQEERVVSLCEEYNSLAIRMQEVSRESIAHRTLLEEIRGQIEDLRKVYIALYSDGFIEVENTEMVDIANEVIISGFNALVMRPEAEELTIKELKAVAKLVAMVEDYERRNLQYELDFENPKARELFVAFKS